MYLCFPLVRQVSTNQKFFSPSVSRKVDERMSKEKAHVHPAKFPSARHGLNLWGECPGLLDRIWLMNNVRVDSAGIHVCMNQLLKGKQ